MAQPQSLDEAQFLLPSEFLNGAHFLMDKHNYTRNGTVEFGFSGNLSFPNEFPYEFDSFRTSPVESVVGSTETESSDEQDFLVGLTRRLAQSLLIESPKLGVPCFSKNKPELVPACSPQSTLSGAGSWSGKSTMSKGSPTGPFSQVPSPPTSPFDAKNVNWELIYAAAGQVGRMTMGGGTFNGNQEKRDFLGPTSQNVTVSSLSNSHTGYYPDNFLSPTLSQIQRMRIDQSVKPQLQRSAYMGQEVNKVQSYQQQQIQNRGRATVCGNGRCGYPLNLTQTVWPSLHVQNQKHQTQHQFPASRPGLHGGSGVKKECSGTGVFLPRRYNHHPEPRKKAGNAIGVSKVYIPAKTAQSGNITFNDSKDHAQSRFVNEFLLNHEALMSRRNALFELQKNIRQEVAVNHEIRLPQEWTY